MFGDITFARRLIHRAFFSFFNPINIESSHVSQKDLKIDPTHHSNHNFDHSDHSWTCMGNPNTFHYVLQQRHWLS